MIRESRLAAPGGGELFLVGGILGLAEDAVQVRSALERAGADRVLLGIPFEDLDSIRTTSGTGASPTFERGPEDDLYVRLLARFGPVQVPPGDLYAAFEFAKDRNLPVEPIDLGDEGHTAVYTQHVGIFEIMKQNRRRKRLDQEPFGATNAVDFAREWDERLAPTKGLRRVQVEREVWMAKRIAACLRDPTRAAALVPLARFPGVRARLVSDHGFRTLD